MIVAQLNPDLDVFSSDIVCWERGQHAGRTRAMNREVLFRNLVEIHEVLDRFDIRHWLSHGTMLGVYRDGNFIPWDDDADLGMDFADRGTKAFNKAMAELRKLGYHVPPSNPNLPIDKENAPYYDMVAIKDGEKVEGWFFEKVGEHYIYDLPRCGNNLKHPARFYEVLGSIDFKGVKFDCPNHIEDWLVMMYGNGWKTPDPNRKYNNQA